VRGRNQTTEVSPNGASASTDEMLLGWSRQGCALPPGAQAYLGSSFVELPVRSWFEECAWGQSVRRCWPESTTTPWIPSWLPLGRMREFLIRLKERGLHGVPASLHSLTPSRHPLPPSTLRFGQRMQTLRRRRACRRTRDRPT